MCLWEVGGKGLQSVKAKSLHSNFSSCSCCLSLASALLLECLKQCRFPSNVSLRSHCAGHLPSFNTVVSFLSIYKTNSEKLGLLCISQCHFFKSRCTLQESLKTIKTSDISILVQLKYNSKI